MNEKELYEDMLDIPENTSSITLKNIKKKRTKKKPTLEQVKEELVNKVNNNNEEDKETLQEENNTTLLEQQENVEQENSASIKVIEKPRIKWSVTTIQMCVIGLLLAVILVTNAVNVNSGINVFLRGILGTDSQSVSADNRLYFDFTPVINSDGATSTQVDNNGNVIVSGTGSAYAPCDGVVKSIEAEKNGEYTLTIAHNDYFSSVITGLNYCYVFEGDNVFSNIPVGYAKDKDYSMCFKSSDGSILTGYTLNNNQVVWAV